MAAAALRSLVKQRAAISSDGCSTVRKLFSTQTVLESSSFAQRLRDLPKDLPGTNIRRAAAHVSFSIPLCFCPFFLFQIVLECADELRLCFLLVSVSISISFPSFFCFGLEFTYLFVSGNFGLPSIFFY